VIAEQHNSLDSRPLEELLGSNTIHRNSSFDLKVGHRDQIGIMPRALNDHFVKSVTLRDRVPVAALGLFADSLFADSQSGKLVGHDTDAPARRTIDSRLQYNSRETILVAGTEWAIWIKWQSLWPRQD